MSANSPLSLKSAFIVIRLLPLEVASSVLAKIVPELVISPPMTMLPALVSELPIVTTVPNAVIIWLVLSFQIPNVFALVMAAKVVLILSSL